MKLLIIVMGFAFSSIGVFASEVTEQDEFCGVEVKVETVRIQGSGVIGGNYSPSRSQVASKIVSNESKVLKLRVQDFQEGNDGVGRYIVIDEPVRVSGFLSSRKSEIVPGQYYIDESKCFKRRSVPNFSVIQMSNKW